MIQEMPPQKRSKNWIYITLFIITAAGVLLLVMAFVEANS